MREKIIVIVIFLSPWIFAAPRQFFWEDSDESNSSSESDSAEHKLKPNSTVTTTTAPREFWEEEESIEFDPSEVKPDPTTTEKYFELFNKPTFKPKPTTTTTTTEKPKPVHPVHPYPHPPFHHKPPFPPPPQFFGNPFILPPNPFQNFNPIGISVQELFSPNPGQTVPFKKRAINDEGVKRFGPQVTCPCVGGASDDTNPFEVIERVKRQAKPHIDYKNLEKKKKKKKKQKKPKPIDVLQEESSNTGPTHTTIKEESIEGIQTGTKNTSQTTQTHLTAYYMIYVVEVQTTGNNSTQTVVSEQTTSNANQPTASPEASYIAEAAGAIPTEETFSQFQGTATSTGKPGGINIDQTGSSTNNNQGQQEGDGSDEDEEGIFPLLDLSDDDDIKSKGKPKV